MATLSIRLPEDLQVRLRAVSEHSGQSESETVLEAIQQRIEDMEDIRVAEERLAELRAGRSRTYTLEEVERELGLAD
jgi:RHH-type rel operon transcriptional repressor/antitoxin RelB